MFEQICSDYQLGNLRSAPQRLDQTTLHPLWKISTEKGDFAVKEFTLDILQLAQQNKQSLNATQKFAQGLKTAGVPAIVALEYQDQFANEFAGNLCMVFPWSEAKVIKPGKMDEQHIYQVGVLLAKVHQHSSELSIEVPGHKFLPAQEVLAQLEQSAEWDFLKEISGSWIVEVQKWIAALPAKKISHPEWVISHRDFDYKNILWDEKKQPILLDWDYAGKIDAAAELFIVLLNWTNVSGDFIDISLFHQLMLGYQSVRRLPLLHQGVIHYYCDYVVDWINFNLHRSQSLAAQKSIAIKEIKNSLHALLYLRQYYEMISQVLDGFPSNESLS
jgi:Ser/Thr protein kinase RdoA (MazF antagonist)